MLIVAARMRGRLKSELAMQSNPSSAQPARAPVLANAFALYADTVAALYERFGPEALDSFLARSGEDNMLQLKLSTISSNTVEPSSEPASAGPFFTTAAVTPQRSRRPRPDELQHGSFEAWRGGSGVGGR